ncbi:MAG TPA: ATP-binding protein [Frankiaceae bacterium]|nr:ATP-binding protein [Frankiaceae bacterium]
MTEMRVTGVDVDGLLELLGRHLYTTPAVALRELVQNAHDSIVRRRLADPAFPCGRIDIETDVARGTLTVTDDGAGMTDAEVVDLLATIGAGATRLAREESGDEDLIGLFGVGFLSAFVIGRRVLVHTTPMSDPVTGWLYASAGGRQYTLTATEPRPVGARVTVELQPDARRLGDAEVVSGLATRYFALLGVPVHLNGAPEPVNDLAPPWRTEPGAPVEHPVAATRRRLEFAARFERRFEPLCTVDVEPDEDSDVTGLLWVQSGATYGSSDNRNVAVFVRGMLLDDDARELLPRWAGFCGGVLESRRLTPTASREDLQRDDHWYAAQRALSVRLVSGLAAIAKEQPDVWRTVLRRHNEALLGAALADPVLFDLLADSLQVPTSEGDLTAREVARRGGGRVHVSLGEGGGFEETVFRAMKVPIAIGTRYGVAPFLREWGQRAGAAVVELGTAAGDRQVFVRAGLPPDDRAWLVSVLGDPGEEVVPARFAPGSIPLVVVPDRDVALKRRIEADEADRRIGRAALALARAHTATIDGRVERRVYVNLDSPVMQRLLADPDRDARPAVLALLRALKGLTAGTRGGAGVDLDASLSLFSDTLLTLLDGS